MRQWFCQAKQWAQLPKTRWVILMNAFRTDLGLMGLIDSLSLDDLTKYIRPPRHDMNEGRQVINKRI